MSLIKTEKGKLALQMRDRDLSARDRQILILSNGTRCQVSLFELMGKSVDGEILRSVNAGYLRESSAVMAVPKQPVAAPAKPVAKPVLVSQQAASRRSLAGTKMYIIDMLQLMRDMDASSMAVAIHTSEGETEFVHNVIVAVQMIVQKSSHSYGLRIINKLREIIPATHLPAVDALEFEVSSLELSVA